MARGPRKVAEISYPFSELAVNIKLLSSMRGRGTFIRLRVRQMPQMEIA